MNTPYYSYDLDLLERTLKQILLDAEDYQIHYAIKANTDQRINNIIAKHGFGVDCVSGNEILHALQCGYDAKKIVFAGVGKTDQEIEIALEHDIACFNVESNQEIQVINRLAKHRGKIVRIAIRVNPNISADTHQYITTGKNENKFGISCEHLIGAVRLIEDSHYLKLTGLHFHIGSQILNMDNFKDLSLKVNHILSELYDEGIDVEHINLGGGLGIDYEHPSQNPIADFASFFDIIRNNLKVSERQKVHFELGRSLVGQCGSLHTRVLYIKQGVIKQFAIVDAGMTDLLRPALYEAEHVIIKKDVLPGEEKEQYDIVGPICESSDVFRRDYSIERLKRGDELIIQSVGAYGQVMVSEYNLRSRPQVQYKQTVASFDFPYYEELIMNLMLCEI